MTEIDHHRDIAYVETGFGLQSEFTVSSTSEGTEVAGTCPACGGRTITRFERGMPGGTKGFFSRRTEATFPKDATVFCDCGHLHADRPEFAIDNGCGAFWEVELP